MFSLAGLYTGFLAKAFIESNVNSSMLRAPPNLYLVFFGYLVLSFLMTIAYQRFVTVKGSPAWCGIRFGMMSGVVWLMPYSLVLFGVYNFPYIVLPVDFIWALVEQGLGGLVIGIIFGRDKHRSAQL
jgi:hypothetical protein